LMLLSSISINNIVKNTSVVILFFYYTCYTLLYKEVEGKVSSMLALRLEAQLEKRVAALARLQGRNKSALVREALIRYMEDQEDILLAEAVVRNLSGEKTLTHEEARRALGLED